LSSTLAAYSRSIGALERSAYLDRVIRGEKPDQEMKVLPRPQTADQMTEAQRRVQYRAELHPLIGAVEALYDALPDLVSLQDVLDRLDPVLAAPVLAASLHSRAPLAVSKALKKLGAASRDAGNTADGTRVRLYILREAERFAGMKGRKLYAAYQALKSGIGSGGSAVAVQRPSARRAVGQRASRTVNAGPVRPRKPSHSRQMEG
jgi:hypothetical protein